MGKFLKKSLRFFLMLLLALLFTNCLAHLPDDDDQWKLRKVYNVRWNVSKSFMAVQFDNDNIFYYGMDSDNMLVQFHTYEDTGAAYCEIGVIPEDAVGILGNFQEAKYCFSHHNEQPDTKCCGSTFCRFPMEILASQRTVDWQIADGTYNKPSKAPQCLYDFYVSAKVEKFEYELFRYCAKAYFFNGNDYDQPARFLKSRKDWLLFLAEGKLTCGLGGGEIGKEMLAHGYKVELVHVWDRQEVICPPLEATLSAYEDRDAEGSFFFAAVVGAGQLDGTFHWQRLVYDGKRYAPDRKIEIEEEEGRFWDEQTFSEKLSSMDDPVERGCYENYHKWLRNHFTARYNLQLRVTHHCTGRSMRETIVFDVSVGPEQVSSEGIYEDTDIIIDLTGRQLIRSTRMLINGSVIES